MKISVMKVFCLSSGVSSETESQCLLGQAWIRHLEWTESLLLTPVSSNPVPHFPYVIHQGGPQFENREGQPLLQLTERIGSCAGTRYPTPPQITLLLCWALGLPVLGRHLASLPGACPAGISARWVCRPETPTDSHTPVGRWVFIFTAVTRFLPHRPQPLEPWRLEVAREEDGSSEKLVGGGSVGCEGERTGVGVGAAWAALPKPGLSPLMPNGAGHQAQLAEALVGWWGTYRWWGPVSSLRLETQV